MVPSARFTNRGKWSFCWTSAPAAFGGRLAAKFSGVISGLFSSIFCAASTHFRHLRPFWPRKEPAAIKSEPRKPPHPPKFPPPLNSH